MTQGLRLLDANNSRISLVVSASAVVIFAANSTAFAGSCIGDPPLCAGRGYASAGGDSEDAIVVNADSDGDGPALWAVVVGRKYTGYGSNLDGSDPGALAQFRVQRDAIVANENVTISGSKTLIVGGTTTTTGSLIVNGGIDGENFDVADGTGDTTVGGMLEVRDDFTFDSNGSTIGGAQIVGRDNSLMLKGGTNSGVLTLQDGDAGEGTTLSISGSGGGPAATVLQATTNPDTTSVTTTIGTGATLSGGSTAKLQAGPTNSVTVNSGNAGVDPGISINGVVGPGSTSKTGVLITGSGQNAEPYTLEDRENGTVPTWADVAIQSKSYGFGDPTLGSAILLTDYGVQILSPQPVAGQTITNTTGANSSTGTIVNNNGMNTSSGSVTNNSGLNSGSGSVANNFGNNTGAGNVTNTIGQNNGSGNLTNTIGGGTGQSTNNFGVGGLSTNTIGSTTVGSSVTTQAGNTLSYMANGVWTTGVNADTANGIGGSVLVPGGTTTGNNSVTLKGASTPHIVADRNGKLSEASGEVAQTSASMTVTNGIGNVNGFYVNERQATISGGARSSSLTLSDNGATFSNSQTGAPIRVHGVADGKDDFDAVNVRQLYRGIAASMATLPQIDLKSGEFGFGIGTGIYGGEAAIGASFAYRSDAAQFNFGAAYTDGSPVAFRGGVGWKW